jgi:hypothetical protein
MSFDTYAGLQAEVALLLNKTNLNAQIPSFIRLAEAQFSRRIRHYRMTERVTFTLDSDRRSLPCDYLGASSFKVGNYALIYVSPDQMDDVRDAGTAWNGPPQYYTVVGSDFLFSPGAGTETAVLRYWKRIPQLSSRCKCNWLLETHPDLYLYGAALQAAPYLRDDDRIRVWQGFFNEAIDAINNESIEAQFGAHIEVQTRAIA